MLRSLSVYATRGGSPAILRTAASSEFSEHHGLPILEVGVPDLTGHLADKAGEITAKPAGVVATVAARAARASSSPTSRE